MKMSQVSSVESSNFVCARCGGVEFWGPYSKTINDRGYVCKKCRKGFSIPIFDLCVICGMQFRKKVRKKTCSKKCSDLLGKQLQKKYREDNKVDNVFNCVICGKSFVRVQYQLTCSEGCSLKRKEDTRKKYYAKHKKRLGLINTDWWRKHRVELVEFLGGVCVRCGVEDVRVLEVDHVDNDGAEDLKRYGINRNMYLHYNRHPELAREKLQVLCSNCNSIKRYENRRHADMVDVIDLVKRLNEDGSFDISQYVKDLGLSCVSPEDPYGLE